MAPQLSGRHTELMGYLLDSALSRPLLGFLTVETRGRRRHRACVPSARPHQLSCHSFPAPASPGSVASCPQTAGTPLPLGCPELSPSGLLSPERPRSSSVPCPVQLHTRDRSGALGRGRIGWTRWRRAPSVCRPPPRVQGERPSRPGAPSRLALNGCKNVCGCVCVCVRIPFALQ